MVRSVFVRAKLAAAAMLLALGPAPTSAGAAEVTAADLRAVANALGFLDGLPRGVPIAVGIVYGSDNAQAKEQAAQTAALLQAIPGPNQSSFRPALLTARDLAQTQSHFDALLLMPSAVGDASLVADAARRRKMLTVSTDPSCLQTGCCALMVRSVGRVQIVLDTAVAGAVGASFASVFTMMVERR